MMISEADKAILIAQDDRTLAEWWCQLNRWEWPAAIPNPEPREYKGPHGRRGQIMNWIIGVIGMELALRVWNKDRLTDQEFSEWWELARGWVEELGPPKKEEDPHG